MSVVGQTVQIPAGAVLLDSDLAVPGQPTGVVLFAHGSGSSRHSPRNRYVAAELQAAGLATLLADLLTPAEEQLDARTGQLRFDIGLLALRVTALADWAVAHRATACLPVGRPDLAGQYLRSVRQPTLLIVGEHDPQVIELNRQAMRRLPSEARLEIIPGASHLFEEPGTLDQVARLATEWFSQHCGLPPGQPPRRGQRGWLTLDSHPSVPPSTRPTES
jgi:putative phosphoribosyl transferase